MKKKFSKKLSYLKLVKVVRDSSSKDPGYIRAERYMQHELEKHQEFEKLRNSKQK